MTALEWPRIALQSPADEQEEIIRLDDFDFCLKQGWITEGFFDYISNYIYFKTFSVYVCPFL